MAKSESGLEEIRDATRDGVSRIVGDIGRLRWWRCLRWGRMVNCVCRERGGEKRYNEKANVRYWVRINDFGLMRQSRLWSEGVSSRASSGFRLRSRGLIVY